MIVIGTVHVRSEDGHHAAVLRAGDTVPDWATVTNPAVLAASPEAPAAPEPKPASRPAKRTSAKATPPAE